MGLGPFSTLLCSEAGAYISGSVFSVTSAGRVSVYSQSEQSRKISNPDAGLWNMDKLAVAAKNDLLSPDYVAPCSQAGW